MGPAAVLVGGTRESPATLVLVVPEAAVVMIGGGIG